MKMQTTPNSPIIHIHTHFEISTHLWKTAILVSVSLSASLVQTNKAIEILRAHFTLHAFCQKILGSSTVFIQLTVCHWKLCHINKFPNHFAAMHTYVGIGLASSHFINTKWHRKKFQLNLFVSYLFRALNIQVHFIRIRCCLYTFDFRPFHFFVWGCVCVCFGWSSSLYYVSWIPKAKMNVSLISHHRNVNIRIHNFFSATNENSHSFHFDSGWVFRGDTPFSYRKIVGTLNGEA